MKLNEILEKLNNGDRKEFLIKLKFTNLPLLLKRGIVNQVCNFAMFADERTGLIRNDKFVEELMLALDIIIECTDIEIDSIFDEENQLKIDYAFETYDKLVSSGILSFVESSLENNDLRDLIDYEVKQRMKVENSVSAVLARGLSEVIEKLPTEEGMKNVLGMLPESLANLTNLEVLTGDKKKGKK